MNLKLNKINKTHISILIILLVLFINNNFFINTFVIIKNTYEKRMINVYGYCDKQGYGFLSDVKNMINIQQGILIINGSTDVPHTGWMINQFNVEKKPKFKIYLNYKKPENLNQILFSKENCYLVKND